MKTQKGKRHRKIIFEQGQSPGDILTFTHGLYDVKRAYSDWEIDVRSPCPAIFEHNPFTTDLSENDPEVEVYPIRYDLINESGWRGLHFADAFRKDIEKKINQDEAMIKKWGYCEIPGTGLSPEIYISKEETIWWNQAHCEYLWDGPYWVLNAGRKPDNELKQYHRWQEVVDLLNEYFQGKVLIAQMGHPDHIHPKLKGTLDFIGKTNLRELIRLVYWSTGTIGPISFQFVLAAAMMRDHKGEGHERPGVVVFGGKEGPRWHLYNHIKFVSRNGQMECAQSDGCWLGGNKGECKNIVKSQYTGEDVPKCFELTEPSEIAREVILYYEGGRLTMPEKNQWWDEENDKQTEEMPERMKEELGENFPFE